MKVTKCGELGRKLPWKFDGYFGGRRVRRFFGSEGEARAELKRLTGERVESGPAGDRLSPRERLVFADLRDRVTGAGGTMEEAVAFWLEHAGAGGSPMRMEDLLVRVLEVKEREGKSAKYLDQLRSTVGQFCRWEGCGYRWAHEVTRWDVERWVEGNGWAAKTRRNYVINVRSVLEMGRKLGAVRMNATDGMDLPPSVEGEVVVLSPGEVARLVVRCLPRVRGRYAGHDHGCLLPYVVLGCFAGLRPERELGLLRVGDIHLDEGAVVVSAGSAKSRARRVVDLSPNAVGLLRIGLPMLVAHWSGDRGAPARVEDMRLVPRNFKRRWDGLRRACGFELSRWQPEGRWWKGDVMRHSFASYHFAMHQNENVLKAQMGHAKGSDVLWQHYRLRVTRRESERFWGIGGGGVSDLGVEVF